MTVAIPVRNGGELFARLLATLGTQTVVHELLVCDSGSSDRSVELAREHGARVIEIPPREFGHGRTRNLLMSEARGAHVAFLSHDAEPADPGWLEALLGGFALGDDVALVYGPYLPRPGASPAVRIELERWFESLSPDGSVRVERLTAAEREAAASPVELLLGRRGFFSDANSCVARSAWERTPFRDVGYAEDRLLALDMMRAGCAKAYVPAAAVLHSHDYRPVEQMRRSFDEARALREIFGWRAPAGPRTLVSGMRGELGFARRRLRAEGAPPARSAATLAAVSRHHVVRLAGTLLGSRADRLAPSLRARLSLEARDGFRPLEDHDQERPPRSL